MSVGLRGNSGGGLVVVLDLTICGWVCSIREVKIPNEPQQSLGSNMFLGLELVADEVLDGG